MTGLCQIWRGRLVCRLERDKQSGGLDGIMARSKTTAQDWRELTIELSDECATGNFWIDNGLAYLLSEFGPGSYKLGQLWDHVLPRLVVKTGRQDTYFDADAQEEKSYEKRTWIAPANAFIKVVDSGAKITLPNGKKVLARPPKYEITPDFTSRKNPCAVCGREDRVQKTKMWCFPFVVDPGKFANFYSCAREPLRMCTRCVIAGLAAHLAVLWSGSNDNLMLFLFHGELPELVTLHRVFIQPKRAANDGNGRLADLPYRAEYASEAALALLLQMAGELHEQQKHTNNPEIAAALAYLFGCEEETRGGMVLYVLRMSKSQFAEIREVAELTDFYTLFQRWRDLKVGGKQMGQGEIERVFQQFQIRKQKRVDTLYRERIARAILSRADPTPAIEDYLSEKLKEKEKSPLVFGTIEVLDVYLVEVLEMNEDMLRRLKGFGYSLGKAVQEKQEMGILYQLRNAKTVDEMLRVLNDIQFRLEMTVPEDLLEVDDQQRIKGVPWNRVRTLLSIYAMNAYLRQEGSKKAEEKEEEAKAAAY